MEMEVPSQTLTPKPIKQSFVAEVWGGIRQIVNKKFVADILATIIKESIKGFLVALGGTLMYYARKEPSEITTSSQSVATRSFGAPPPPPPPPGYPGGGYPGSNAFNVAPSPASSFGNFPR